MDNSVNVNQTHILLMFTQYLKIKTQQYGKAGESDIINFFFPAHVCLNAIYFRGSSQL